MSFPSHALLKSLNLLVRIPAALSFFVMILHFAARNGIALPAWIMRAMLFVKWIAVGRVADVVAVTQVRCACICENGSSHKRTAPVLVDITPRIVTPTLSTTIVPH